ncbi:hypothetical protein HIM_10406 [Hirsutella minnesotensis 3608]|uniref:2EXR domain-containing protein n=1 Tax=Hirsutella minnesotensis 3608 TaxID=1043627 RepID=A0A0F7ZK55_9HYPO|nr:hypothetical protein HIM_10406 [Hirsutella minnesotensis 3608]
MADKPVMSNSAFHLFSQLPTELRQLIWELSMEPREVIVGGLVRRSSTPAPPLLQVCKESRSYLQNRYKTCVLSGDLKKSRLINFDIDTAYCPPTMSLNTIFQIAPVRWLKVEFVGVTGGCFLDFFLDLFTSLDTLIMIYLQRDPYSQPDEEWEKDWVSVMEYYYCRDDPIRFDVEVVHPDLPESVRLTRDNWLERKEYWRRWNLARGIGPVGSD